MMVSSKFVLLVSVRCELVRLNKNKNQIVAGIHHATGYGTQGRGVGGFCTACTRRSENHTLLLGEGTCLVWHIWALESRPPKTKTANYGTSLSHLEPSRPWVGRRAGNNPHSQDGRRLPARHPMQIRSGANRLSGVDRQYRGVRCCVHSVLWHAEPGQ